MDTPLKRVGIGYLLNPDYGRIEISNLLEKGLIQKTGSGFPILSPLIKIQVLRSKNNPVSLIKLSF